MPATSAAPTTIQGVGPLLIFFFAFAKVVHLDGRLVYLAVLFVYFYPWEAMRRVAGLGPRR